MDLTPFYKAFDLNCAVTLQSTHPQVLKVSYTLEGASTRLMNWKPAKEESQRERKDGLWRSTCFEFFWSFDGISYYEMNLSESGDWNFYLFEDYRSRSSSTVPNFIKSLTVSSEGERFSLEVTLESDRSWSEVKSHNISLVFVADGRQDYFALAHRDQPDFHAKEIWQGKISIDEGAE